MHIDVLHYKDKRSDKIWGYVLDSKQCIVFYGKRKGSLKFIEHASWTSPHYFVKGENKYGEQYLVPPSAQKTRKGKLAKGYVPVLESEHEDYLPESFKESLMLAKLGMGLREAVQ